MCIFNPHILDANIRDVIVRLSDTQKADVLLHALQYLPVQGCHIAMENAVQSLLQVHNLPSDNIARALLLRVNGRLAAGDHTSAQQDLQSALTVDPDNQDVKATIQSQHPRLWMLLRDPNSPPRLPEELWRQIALFLPKRDLKSLLLVPNALSRIASQLLFREIDLHLTTAIEPGTETTPMEVVDKDVNAWHDQRSADILTQMLVDSDFASRLRNLSIFAVSSDGMSPLAFKIGMLTNALSRLSNVQKVHCTGNKELISRVFQTVHLHCPRLQQLSIVVTEHIIDIEVPIFKHITHFAISSRGGSRSAHTLASQNRDTLCSLSVTSPHSIVPSSIIYVSRLTQIQFNGYLSRDAFSGILANGHHLESLMLSGMLPCIVSTSFRQCRTALQSLCHFSLTITGIARHIEDRDLCPAISKFLRKRIQLQTYRLLVSSAAAHHVGFDASAWGVLPTLPKLSGLSITYPKDLSPALAGWLVPHTVRALTLDLSSGVYTGLTFVDFMNRLGTNMPPLLCYIGVTNIPATCSAIQVVEHGFRNVRVARVDGTFWTVTRPREDGAPEMEQWPRRRAKYHAADWLESLGCADAIWEGVDGPWCI